MTQHPHDQLSKELLEELLTPLGAVQRSLEIPGEAKLVDLYFSPETEKLLRNEPSELLSRIARRRCLIEPFRNPPSRIEVRSCLLKLLWVQEDLRRKAERSKKPLVEEEQPVLWILGTSIHKPVLDEFGAKPALSFGDGIYETVSGLGLKFISINELPRNRDTLTLRVLGRGKIQQEAIADVFALPDEPMRSTLLRILSSWKYTLELGEIEFDERESIVALSQAFLEWEQVTEQKGLEQGEKSLIIRLLTKKLGAIAPNITSQIQSLSLEKTEALGEALLEFERFEDLQQWLEQH